MNELPLESVDLIECAGCSGERGHIRSVNSEAVVSARTEIVFPEETVLFARSIDNRLRNRERLATVSGGTLFMGWSKITLMILRDFLILLYFLFVFTSILLCKRVGTFFILC